MTPDFLLQLALAVCGGFGAYAAIRSDLATLHERATVAKDTADKAHERIDQLFKGH